MDIQSVVILGLVVAFWADLAARSEAAPKWVYDLRRLGKPWSCPVCMSFWISVLVWGVVALTSANFLSVLISLPFAVPASAMISILVIAFMKKLELFVVPSR